MDESVGSPVEPEQVYERLFGHPLAKAIEVFVRRVRDIEDCERHFVPLAITEKVEEREAIASDGKKLLSMIEPSDQPATGGTIRALANIMRRLDRVFHSQRADTLRSSLFIGMFSVYDTFTGDLVAALFSMRPELFRRIGREIPVADVLAAPTLEELKTKILGDWIEDLRRKSYVEQFEVLEKVFDIKLKAFDRWSSFVEIGQRRNLFAHCNGVVSPQYIEICRREGNIIDAAVGTSLTISEDYFGSACRALAEVGLKLGQTLWRKVAPSEVTIAEKQLHHLAYEALQFSEWEWAKTIGYFGLSQKSVSTEQNRLVFVVNQAIALMRSGDRAAANSLLDAEDWSATSLEFRLAAAVLRENFDEAGTLMERIGAAGDLLDDSGYYDWPLFADFRGTPQFLAAYEKVYGRSFASELSSSASLKGLGKVETTAAVP